MKRDKVYLIGFMGVGKSTVASMLAAALGVRSFDTDTELEKRAGERISDIFAKHGEEYFRDLETETLRVLAAGASSVISCGGGLVLRPENREVMRESGHTILLTATPETVYSRVHHSTHRPLLNGNMNVPYIASLMEERRERYEKAAEFSVATDDRTTAQIVAEIQRILLPSDQSSGDFS